MKNILVIAVHPDDETLGCGGTLLKYKAKGHNIHWLIMTKADTKLGYSTEIISKRESEIHKVGQIFGFSSIHRFDFLTTCLDQYSMNDLIQKIYSVFEEIKPEIVYLPNRSDIHSDHRITFEAAMSCTKSFRFTFLERIYMMETLSETELAPFFEAFTPNSYENISEYYTQKIELIKIYEAELGQHPFPRSIESIEALAKFRGASSGFNYAEAFVLLKELNH